MKYTVKNILTTLYFSIALFSFNVINAQDLDKATVKKAVEAHTFTFRAETAFPMGGNVKQLTPGYDLYVKDDSLSVYLPYYGRAYSAPLPGEGPIKFQSEDFIYKAKIKKKDSWEIIIQPEDTGEVRKMVLRIFDNGNATLMITSNNRQAISFNGYITVQ